MPRRCWTSFAPSFKFCASKLSVLSASCHTLAYDMPTDPVRTRPGYLNASAKAVTKALHCTWLMLS